MKKDFCEWWTPKKIAEHNAEWLRQKTYEELSQRVIAVMMKYKLRSVIELGCGAGHVGGLVAHWGVDYLGIDACPDMIKLATLSNPGVEFRCENIRTLGDYTADLVCSFAVLKHFSNEDFPEILKRCAPLAISDCSRCRLHSQGRVWKIPMTPTGTHGQQSQP